VFSITADEPLLKSAERRSAFPVLCWQFRDDYDPSGGGLPDGSFRLLRCNVGARTQKTSGKTLQAMISAK
jgi:hypothetical protein